MINPVTAAEKLMYVTVRIVGLNAAGVPIKFGTGFFYNQKFDDTNILPLLITNKHVVDGVAGVELVFHNKNLDAERPTGNIPVRLDFNLGVGWINHPNSAVDLCAFVIGGVLNSLSPPPFLSALDKSLVPDSAQLEALDAVEDIIMVGYPNGLWDETNNFPLIRKGITATHPAVPYYLKATPSVPLTVVDIASFGGSSGSPVFIYNRNSYGDKKGNIILNPRFIFLGILFKARLWKVTGKLL